MDAAAGVPGSVNPKYKDLPDINARELFTLVPIGLIVLILGVYPMPALEMFRGTMSWIVQMVHPAAMGGLLPCNGLPGLMQAQKLGTMASLPYLLPEFCVLAGLLVVLFWDLLRGRPGSRGEAVAAFVFLIAAAVATAWQWASGTMAGQGILLFDGMMANDALSCFFKVICLLAAAFAVLFSLRYPEFRNRRMGTISFTALPRHALMTAIPIL